MPNFKQIGQISFNLITLTSLKKILSNTALKVSGNEKIICKKSQVYVAPNFNLELKIYFLNVSQSIYEKINKNHSFLIIYKVFPS